MAMCEAGATAKCDVSAMADAECQGKCEGSVEPPEVSAECQASVDAKANASVECTPPSLSVSFQFAAGLTVEQQAEFKIWLEGFKVRFAGLLAAQAKLEIVGEAAAGLIGAAGGAVNGAFEAIASDEGSLSFSAIIGIGCAIDQLDAVGSALGEAQGEITASLSATASVAGAVGG
jgi:hypothetical protein